MLVAAGNEIGRWTLSLPLWSCSWDGRDRSIFFCGAIQNKLFLIDTKQQAAVMMFAGVYGEEKKNENAPPVPQERDAAANTCAP